jgi:hypothetical protein
MPDSAEILTGLMTIANRAIGAAIAWHVVVAIALVALAIGWRPFLPLARALIALPLASVAAFAFLFGNPFNGIMFAVGSVTLVALARVGGRRAVQRGTAWGSGIGIASLAFGWVYPHFLEGNPTAYLFAAPLGLVPCPTLAAAIGFALLGGGLGARAWGLTLAALGLFYGLFGVLRLGVLLDAGLVIGAITLLVAALRSESPPDLPSRRKPLQA